MAKKIRILILIWFTTRIIYLYNAKHDSFVADEMYWFATWAGLIGFTYLMRELLTVKIKPEDIRLLRKDLNKLGLMFAMYFLWEILNCINSPLAYSDIVYCIMLFIVGLLMALIIITK